MLIAAYNEVVVVSDGSPDRTDSILTGFANPRVRPVRIANRSRAHGGDLQVLGRIVVRQNMGTAAVGRLLCMSRNRARARFVYGAKCGLRMAIGERLHKVAQPHRRASPYRLRGALRTQRFFPGGGVTSGEFQATE